MSEGWMPGPVDLPDAVRYTLTTGDGPTDLWHVSVALPSGPRAGPGPYPVLYLLDAFQTFLTAAQLARNLLSYGLGQLRPVAIAGISPASDDLERLRSQRVRDLTPTRAESRYQLAETSYGTGGAAAMLDLIVDVIAPYVESAHPLDPGDRALGGFSLGGLFTCWALTCRPQGFRRFLAASPSLWWDDHLLLSEQRAPIAGRASSDAYLAVGELEDSPDRSWPAIPPDVRAKLAGLDMVADLAAFTDRLRAHPAIRAHGEVIPGEQHATIWPTAFTRAFLHLYRTDRSAPAA